MTTAALVLKEPTLAVAYAANEKALDAEWAAEQAKAAIRYPCRLAFVNLEDKVGVIIEPQERDFEKAGGTTVPDLDLAKLGTIYRVTNSSVLPPRFRKGESGQVEKVYRPWSIELFPEFYTLPAPIWGTVIDQSFDSKTATIFSCQVDKSEEGIKLECIAENLMGRRHREALDMMRDVLLKQDDSMDQGDDTMYDCMLPTIANFNANQQLALETAMRYRVSGIIGPPATGKTRILVELIKLYHRLYPEHKILVTAVTHVAVDAIFKQLMDTARNHGLAEKVTRFYGNPRIVADMLKDPEDVQSLGEAHIGSRCVALAGKDGVSAKSAYMAGWLQMKKSKRIRAARAEDRCWVEQHNWLKRRVLATTSVLFSTSGALRSEELCADGGSWGASLCIIDEAGSAKPVDILQVLVAMNITAQRFVFAGDPSQLGPCILSETAQEIWRPSWFTSFEQSSFPITHLEIQYRSHDRLYEPTSKVFYSDKVISSRRTSAGTAFLQSLSLEETCSFFALGRRYDVNSFRGFFDVSYCKQNRKENGGYSNQGEVMVVSALVTLLIRRLHIPPRRIAVLTGYRAQSRLLEQEAHRSGWSEVNVKSVDSVQGAEYDIVIISLVRSKGGAGFMGEKGRANVATSRAREALYFVGNWHFWSSMAAGDRKIWAKKVVERHYMTDILSKHDEAYFQDTGHDFIQMGIKACNESSLSS